MTAVADARRIVELERRVASLESDLAALREHVEKTPYQLWQARRAQAVAARAHEPARVD